ncbi:MAG: hypothetical protein IJV06_11485 [Bacteroidaceae bacterium]|nr:hypothetical protein [Bacteroidaceae bacterium]
MKSIVCVCCSLLCYVLSLGAQSQSFSVCALNVDGLPASILNYEVNPDGPGSEGTRLISAYLAKKGYDVVAVSEDFNYNGSLLSELTDYNAGTWRGGLDAGSIAKALTNGSKVDTDGLNLLWRNVHSAEEERWVSWEKTFGNLDNGFDENVDKGYRYYKLTLESGAVIDLYTLHMDAETAEGDLAAREVQLQQLAAAIIANTNGRPKIVMGDTNCRYTRDQLKKLFVDAINSGTSYTVKDAWVEYSRKGSFPAYHKTNAEAYALTDASQGLAGPNYEIVDKIFFINPAHGLQLSLKSLKVEEDYVNAEGKMLGDHYPLVAEFETVGSQLLPTEATDFWEGETETAGGTYRYLYNVGSGYFLNETGALVPFVADATPWGMWGDGDTRTFSTDNGYRLVLGWKNFSYYCHTQNSSGATSFSLQTGWSRPDAFKLKASNHYVNVAWNENYSLDAGTTYETDLSDWLFLSETQVALYNKYVETFNRAMTCLNYPLSDVCYSGLVDALAVPVRYSTADAAIRQLAEAMDAIQAEWAGYDVERDYTSSKIKNPSFEKMGIARNLGDNVNGENHSVYGWTVSTAAEAEEAFASWENEQNGNGRYFTGMDGTHIFNAWSPGGNGTFYCKQDISITKEGYYALSATVASGGGWEGDTWVNLVFGNAVLQSPVLIDRTLGVPLTLYTYCKKGTYTIGLESARWFKADKFRLLLLSEPKPQLPGDVNEDGKVDLLDITTLINLYLDSVTNVPAADVNGDGNVNLLDITTLINLYLGV